MNKGKERKKREGKQKKGVGIGVKIVALLLLLAVAALSCMGVLVQTLQRAGADPCHDHQQCDNGKFVG